MTWVVFKITLSLTDQSEMALNLAVIINDTPRLLIHTNIAHVQYDILRHNLYS